MLKITLSSQEEIIQKSQWPGEFDNYLKMNPVTKSILIDVDSSNFEDDLWENQSGMGEFVVAA